jgi:AraC-like DNA-binding protein
MITEAFQEFMDKKYGYELAVSTNICKIFLWVLRSWNDKGLTILSRNVLKEKDIHRLQKVFDCFDSQYMNNLTAENMARQCNMSYSYFSRFFKSTIGKNFSAYLNFVRITKAEKLLLSTDKTITDIAMETGFSSASYFISQFRQIKNISPNHYRQKLELFP